MTDLLRLDGVTKRFTPGDHPAVDGLNFSLASGEIVSLLGPSGCGKTTTLRLIAGFEAPDSGVIQIRGQIIAGPGTWVPPERRGVGIVFQDYALFPHLTVAENVAFGLHKLSRPARTKRVQEILEVVGLTELIHRYPHELSGGQQQRVAVARALAPAPSLVLLDEPFSNLDADLRAQMRDEIGQALRSTGTTAIFVTHDQEEAFTLADRVGVLNRGRLEQFDTPETVYHYPATRFVAEFVGAADFIPGRVTSDGIETVLGRFANPAGLPVGSTVEIMIRPDDITFTPDSNGPATVIHRHFRGPENLYCLRLPSGHRVHSSQPSTTLVPDGTKVAPIAHVIHVVAFPAASRP